jgi:hypothetical protein
VLTINVSIPTGIWLCVAALAFFSGVYVAWKCFRCSMRWEAEVALIEHDRDLLDSLRAHQVREHA